MAKDDYFVIVYKILSYLYVKLKSGEDVNPNMITHDNQLLQINRKYWDYIMRNLIEDRYITCETEKVWGKELIYDLKTAEITPEADCVCVQQLLDRESERIFERHKRNNSIYLSARKARFLMQFKKISLPGNGVILPMKDIVKRQEESYDGNETGTSDAYSIRNDSLLKNTRTRSCGTVREDGERAA